MTKTNATESLTRTQLAKDVARRLDVSVDRADKALVCVLDSIADAVRSGKQVSLIGFGVFHIHDRAGVMRRNPQTGEPVMQEASRVVKFRPSPQINPPA